jgi:hypothetical protein
MDCLALEAEKERREEEIDCGRSVLTIKNMINLNCDTNSLFWKSMAQSDVTL